jgi:hypothetical protein
MALNPKLRTGLLIGALALTLGAVRWVDTAPEVPEASAGAVAEPVGRDGSAARRANPEPTKTSPRGPALDLQKLQRARVHDPEGDPFGPRNFQPAPPKGKTLSSQGMQEHAPPAPPPQAPPLPFAYLGRLSEDSDTTVFLSMGDRNLLVRPGDTIDNTYKVEEVTDSAVIVTYLPMNQRQTLPLDKP